MTNKEISAVVEAADNGKPIQFRHYGDKEWGNIPNPNWNFSLGDYRVAPEPREFWVPEGYVPQWDRDYRLTIQYAKSREECLGYWPSRNPVLFREVL